MPDFVELDMLLGSLLPEIRFRPKPRVLPLLTKPQAYRDPSSEKYQVAFRRRVRCCERGCRACGHVGWRIADESIAVILPIGATLGTVLRIAGKADQEPGRPEDLHLEIVHPGARADALVAVAREHEAFLEASWTDISKRTRAEIRRNGLWLVVMAAMLVVVPFGLGLVVYLTAKWEERCRVDGHCRSNQCFFLGERGGACSETHTGRRY